ncbi:MAG: hypothetical protein MUF38_03580 [Anaerolineae bacterium]|jgi:hypothetical protein|nr:hypothetical protein [Anaerolineae bacterium]
MEPVGNETPNSSNNSTPSLRNVVLGRLIIGALFIFAAGFVHLWYVGALDISEFSLPSILAVVYNLIGHYPFVILVGLIGLAWIYWGVNEWLTARKNRP